MTVITARRSAWLDADLSLVTLDVAVRVDVVEWWIGSQVVAVVERDRLRVWVSGPSPSLLVDDAAFVLVDARLALRIDGSRPLPLPTGRSRAWCGNCDGCGRDWGRAGGCRVHDARGHDRAEDTWTPEIYLTTRPPAETAPSLGTVAVGLDRTAGPGWPLTLDVRPATDPPRHSRSRTWPA